MPALRTLLHPIRSRRNDFDDDMPLVPDAQRHLRLRRGGPRTPLPLVGIIAIVAGIGVAYVNQTARSTQATYQVNSLVSTQRDLQSQDQQLSQQLSRLRASERIVAAAQHLGMVPAGQWAYVAAAPVAVIPSPTPNPSSSPANSSDPVQRVVAALGSAIGIRDVEAASP